MVVIVAAGLAFGLVRSGDDGADICGQVATAEARRSHAVGAGRPVRILGDSYAQGMELADPNDSWPTSFAKEYGARVTIDAQSTTGFTTPGLCNGESFPQRPQTDEGLLIVQGGLNDLDADLTELRDAVCAVLNRPGRTVVVGPAPAPYFDAADEATTDAALADIVPDCGGEYVSALGWDLTYTGVGLHLDEAGHQTFGRAVADAVRAP